MTTEQEKEEWLKTSKERVLEAFRKLGEYRDNNFCCQIMEGIFRHEDFEYTLHFWNQRHLDEIFKDWRKEDRSLILKTMAPELHEDEDKMVLVELIENKIGKKLLSLKLKFYLEGKELQEIFNSYSSVFTLHDGFYELDIELKENQPTDLDQIALKLEGIFEKFNQILNMEDEENIVFFMLNNEDAYTYCMYPPQNDSLNIAENKG